MLEHGGALHAAVQAFGGNLDAWLDLSTGINAQPWPVPSIPARVFSRLPENDGALEHIAARWYGSESLLALPGSQAAIRILPTLRPPGRVGVIAPGYEEHARAWRDAGHSVLRAPAHELIRRADEFDTVVLIHPNNPGGEVFAAADLLALHARLGARGGWLVVDEAFIDAQPEQSLCPWAGVPGLVVLRSPGKFFGLAGLRIGFVFAWRELLERISARLGPWPVNGPARWIVQQALEDRGWQRAMRITLGERSRRLHTLLGDAGLRVTAGTALFQWVVHPRARALQRALARRQVWVRAFDAPASARLGLPVRECEWQQLGDALNDDEVQAVIRS